MRLCVSTILAVLALCSDVFGKCVVKMDVGLGNVRTSFAPYIETFSAFKGNHKKSYKNDLEEAYRFSVFIRNVKEMEAHNLKFHRGETSYFLNVNHFSDMTHDEYLRHNRLGRYSKAYEMSDFARCFQYLPGNSSPESIDWRTKGAVTAVKDQGQCGSCYSFSTTGSIEGQNFRNTGTLLSFSEQQIVDCCSGSDCDGCNGGLMDGAFVYLNQTGGLELEADYSYTAYSGSCVFSTSKAKVKVIGCSDIPACNEAALQDAVGNVGPISVGIDASQPTFMSYAGGIYSDPSCSTTEIDHAVLAVGYGSDNGSDYWLVKNSWGVAWGTDGYFKLSRNNNNECGVASTASFPHTEK